MLALIKKLTILKKLAFTRLSHALPFTSLLALFNKINVNNS
jgi:hypothetical protein